MPTPSTMLSPQQLIDAAKALQFAYNDKDWAAVKTCVTPDITYDEVATHRKVQGIDRVIALWQGWASALPDSRCTFQGVLASGASVVMEVTWHGTHRGVLQMPAGPVQPTGKRIEVRACVISELDGEKVRTQRHYFDMATLLQQLGVLG
jgi:steroid delta-isomerase-like uncharacterized protein